MVEYLPRCGFDPPTWLLLFAVIMDIRLGHVDHRGCVPHTHALRSEAWGRSFQPCVPAFLAGTMELDQIPVEIPGQIRWVAAALALLTVPRSLFPC